MKTALASRSLIVALLALAAACADDSPSADAGVTRDATAGDTGGAPGQCPVTGYAPCGGELKGTWEFVAFCPEDPAAAAALFEHPYDDRPECQRPENPVEGRLLTEGSLTITDSEMQMATTQGFSVSYGFTDACLAVTQRDPGDPETICAAMENDGRMSCSYDAAREPPCSCSGSPPGELVEESMVYEQTGETTLSAGGGEAHATFCVQDDLLTLDWDPHPISWRYWIVRRAP